jgi:hypothetical protein
MPKIAFISGHVDIDKQTFLSHYQKPIDQAILGGESFILGNAQGVDSLALEYLLEKVSEGILSRDQITIYFYNKYSETSDLHTDTKYNGIKIINGFTSYTSRDKLMTVNSDYDIAWIRPVEESKKMYGDEFKPGRISGTELNIQRRKKLLK